MRRYILTTVTLFPLLLCASHAAQSRPVDPPANTWVFSSEDSGREAFLGVYISDVTPDRLEALKLKEEKGVEVTAVDQDAPAGKAGIKEHDVILAMNGTQIESKAQLERMIRETPPGRLVTLGISRDGQPLTIKVPLGDRRKEFTYVPKSGDFHVEIPPIPSIPEIEIPSFVMVHTSARSGVMVENMTPQLGEFFGARNGNGVLVRSVEKGSRGERAGLRAGDVIVRVGEQSIHDSSDFTRALRSGRGNSVAVVVIRDKKEQTLTLTLPPHSESGHMIQESSDTDELDAARTELQAVRNQLAEIQPEMLLAADLREAAKAQCQAAQAQQKQMHEYTEKLREEFQPQVREQLQREREKLQNEMQKLQQEMLKMQHDTQGEGAEL
jgi:serine protease Do